MPEAILGLDIGSTVVKAVLFDLAGHELAVAEQAIRLYTPQPGWAELDPEEIWQAVVQVARGVCCTRNSVERILAVSLATQGGSLIPAEADGTPIEMAITWMDRRAEEVVASWEAAGIAQEIRLIGGWSPQAGLPLPSICWLRQVRPEQFAMTKRFLAINDFVGYKLSGAFGTNPSMAGEMLLVDIRTGQWSQTLCDLAGIQPEQLSPIVASEAFVGELSSEAGRLMGLEAGIPVIAGGQDHSCEALALGMTSAGGFLLACGTAWVLNGVSETSAMDGLPATMDLNFHVVPDRWTLSQFLGGFGGGLEWWLNECQRGAAPHEPILREARYASFDATVRRAIPGSGDLLFFPMSSRRLRVGGFAGLRLDHTKADLGRAVLEGAAFELRWVLEEIHQAGLSLERMWMVGGATRSSLWPQIVADVCGVPLALTQYSHGPALGAALLAGKGLGLLNEYPSWIEPRPIEPNPAHAPVYEERFGEYLQMARELQS
jgi:xylulokinase